MTARGARLYIADDSLERETTFRCPRDAGHEGRHREEFDREPSGAVTMEWEHDEGEPLDEEPPVWESREHARPRARVARP